VKGRLGRLSLRRNGGVPGPRCELIPGNPLSAAIAWCTEAGAVGEETSGGNAPWTCADHSPNTTGGADTRVAFPYDLWDGATRSWSLGNTPAEAACTRPLYSYARPFFRIDTRLGGADTARIVAPRTGCW